VARAQPAVGGSGPSRFYGAAALLAASVLLSRLLGFLREVVLAAQLGAGAEADAYQAAFQLPDILNYLLAGSALSIAFIPFYTRVRATAGERSAERLFAVVLGTTSVLAVAVTGLLWWQADAAVGFLFNDFPPETRALTARLTRIVLPAQVFFVAGGVVRAVLMAHDRFATQALAPLLYNLGIITGGLLFGATLGAEAFAWGALVGAFAGPLLAPLIDARRAGLRLGFTVAPRDPVFWRYLWVAAPLMLGLSLLTVDEWYDRIFGDALAEGSIAHLAYARKLMLLPVAVVGQAIATAALPTLSRLWAEGRRDELERTLLETLQVGLGLALLAGGACLILAFPAVQLVYERGEFTRLDSIVTASLLAVFAFAVPAWITQQIAVRAFYARGDTWRPMLLATAVAVAAFPLYQRSGDALGAEGLALAGVMAMGANALLTLGLARALHGGPALWRLLLSFARGFVVTWAAAMAAQLVLLWRALSGSVLVDLLLAALAYGAVALAGALLIGDAPLRRFLRRRIGRLMRFSR
jgi:putative peptidoglycan lipid II flippase